MITLIEGLTGSGKTWLMTRMLYKEWRAGSVVFVNYPVNFSTDNNDINRWHQLDELYHLNNGIIGIDEAPKLMDARRWASLPMSFAEKVAQHRHHHLDIYTTTQNFLDIDVRVRTNVHELFKCISIFRWPKNERVKPYLQMIKIIRKVKKDNTEGQRVIWEKVGRGKFYLLSRFFTKELYDTYADVGFERYLCRIKYEKKKWILKIYSRDLVNQGRARL